MGALREEPARGLSYPIDAQIAAAAESFRALRDDRTCRRADQRKTLSRRAATCDRNDRVPLRLRGIDASELSARRRLMVEIHQSLRGFCVTTSRLDELVAQLLNDRAAFGARSPLAPVRRFVVVLAESSFEVGGGLAPLLPSP